VVFEGVLDFVGAGVQVLFNVEVLVTVAV